MRLTAKHTTQAMISEKNLTKGQMKELKLSQLEDIEEELGIELSVLFRALKQGYVWYDPTDPEKYEIECLYMEPQIHLYVADGVGCCYMDDYKKEWALTKGELK